MDDWGNDIEDAIDIGSKTVGERTSQFVTQERSSSVRLDDIEEHGPITTRQSGRIAGATVGKTQMGTSHIEVTNQDYGGRYQEVDRHSLTVNSQYNPIKPDIKQNLKNTLNNYLDDQRGVPKMDKDGVNKGGFLLGLIQDGAKAISNFLLEGQAEDVLIALKNEEVKARAKINVLAGKD